MSRFRQHLKNNFCYQLKFLLEIIQPSKMGPFFVGLSKKEVEQ